MNDETAYRLISSVRDPGAGNIPQSCCLGVFRASAISRWRAEPGGSRRQHDEPCLLTDGSRQVPGLENELRVSQAVPSGTVPRRKGRAVTASVTSGTPGKRDRLIAGARETIYRQGFEATTIADIAEASDVPLGNVYYYFKSKDELAAAAIDSYARESRERLLLLEQQHRTPGARLKTLVRLLVSQPDQVALYGCPTGSLCSELGKQDNDLARAGRALMHTAIAWIEQQFKAMGRRDARDLAFALLASYEGTALLANTFRDPDLMVREGRRLERWIDSLARDRKVAPAG